MEILLLSSKTERITWFGGETTFEKNIEQGSAILDMIFNPFCTTNQLTGFYMRATLAFNGLKNKVKKQ